MRGRRLLTTSDIQKEQLFLVQLERELNNVLLKINENLNTLKVEELQLRSQAVNMLNCPKSKQKIEAVAKQEKEPEFDDNPDVVNQQEMDLDLILKHMNEEDDE